MIVSNLISSAPALQVRIIDIPEFGEGAQIMLQEFNAKSASEFNGAFGELGDTKTPDGMVNFYAILVCACAVNEKGEKLLPVSEYQQLVNAWKRDLIFRIGAEAADLNGFMGERREEVKKLSKRNQRKRSSEQ